MFSKLNPVISCRCVQETPRGGGDLSMDGEHCGPGRGGGAWTDLTTAVQTSCLRT